MRLIRNLVVIAALAASVHPVDAQRTRDRDRERSQETPGWIGISFDPATDRRGRVTQLLITEVRSGSPAEEAGVQPGDRLLRVNDLTRTSQLVNLSERLRLRAGDRVRILVERDGRRREFRLRAAARPDDFVAVRVVEPSFRSDSVVETIYRAMDSLRVSIVEGNAGTIRIRTESRTRTSGGVVADVRVVSGAGVSSERAERVEAPFEFFVFRGEEHDSLRREMETLNRDMELLRNQLVSRGRELQRAARTSSAIRVSQDPRLVEIERSLEEARVRSSALRSAMAEAARATAGFEYAAVGAGAPDGRIVTPDPGEFRPLTPYLLGRNRVAGAEVIDMRPELASYFSGVESGVLVVDVSPRTPASLSGIQPGDVITRMDRVAVRTVEDLRFGVSQAGDTLPITLVRRGSTIQLLLRR